MDVAAGSGESTLMAARRVGPTGYVLAADVAASMLNAAAEAARKEGIINIETRVMNAENIELDSDLFDAVICRIALMLFPNPGKALNEMRRVVKPGESRENIALRIPQAAAIRGIVEDAEGRPVTNIHWLIFVNEYGGWGHGESADGRFGTFGVTPKPVQIEVNAEGFDDRALQTTSQKSSS